MKRAYLDVRLDESERAGFVSAANLSGLSLSAWVRERLRRAAIRELEEARRPIPFLEHFKLD